MNKDLLHTDFSIVIDFEKKSENPARVFQSMTDLINAFQKFDSSLIHGMDAKLEPIILLEDVEVGSLRTWLSSRLKGIPDEAVKDGDWKKVIGHYLVRAKYILLNKLNGQLELTDTEVIYEIQSELVAEAEKTDIKLLPHYEPLPVQTIIKTIDEVNQAVSGLSSNDKAYLQANNEKVPFNLDLSFSPSDMEDMLVKEEITSESVMILKVKKPDYLGASMWEFRYNNKSLPAKILDTSWVIQFQQRKVDIRPGDSLKAKVRITVRYGHDNNVMGIGYEILKVIEVLPLNSPQQHTIFVK